MIVLAHGVGSVYQLPVPLYLYLGAAAATVIASFLILGFTRTTHVRREPRALAGGRAAGVMRAVLKWGSLLGLVLVVLTGLVIHSKGQTFPTFGFWIGLIGMVFLSALLSGAWAAADPWRTLEDLYRIGDRERSTARPPWWLGPLLVYSLFWFELVSEAGFDSAAIVVVLFAYSVYVLGLRDRYGERWSEADPLSILFGFAGRVAPLELNEERVGYKGFLRDVVVDTPMSLAWFASIFVLLASTTLDNLRETTAWTSFRVTSGLDSIPSKLFDSLALALFAVPFLLSYLLAIWVAKRWLGSRDFMHLARLFAWSLIPIPVAYVLAHNAPAFISWTPQVLAQLSDPFARGWNLFGTFHAFDSFQASPKLVWFLEIAFVVGGHVLGVTAAHDIALRTAPSTKNAVRSQYALTVLMATFTIVTLWLLAQPLVTTANAETPAPAVNSPFTDAVTGLCAVSDELDGGGDVAAAHDVFLDHAHQPLHELAAALETADRGLAAELLRAIESTDAGMEDLSTSKASQEVDALTGTAVEGLRALSVSPPSCAQ